ncbi:hypothetical protein D0860_06800 [Hortaea werneckii]|uniref:Phosphoglycerate mutase family protein n=2 Tax=Hortaea werneckii TaxID=91943 RepID=A0A3M7I9F4_HORWE|nr:hypothetical protein D0860_06800 [Hortaea werneckii]RMZ22134.1 hypothetical protein D0859_13845 [Hortaea werneckii]
MLGSQTRLLVVQDSLSSSSLSQYRPLCSCESMTVSSLLKLLLHEISRSFRHSRRLVHNDRSFRRKKSKEPTTTTTPCSVDSFEIFAAPPAPMTPRIHCVRHAQGYHNLSVANHSMRDPLLTPYGEEQCRDLARSFPYHDKIDAVVASPIRRTVYTALLGFGSDLDRKSLNVIAMPELQETSDLPCDTGSSPEDLAKEFDGKPVDLGLVQPGWNSKKMQWAANARFIEARARAARLWLMNRPEKDIVVVTHGGFLHYFTEDWSGSDRFAGTGWANTEFRTYTFSSSEPEQAHLVETPESRQRRCGADDNKSLDREEQAQLKRTTSPGDVADRKGPARDLQIGSKKAKEAQRLHAKV